MSRTSFDWGIDVPEGDPEGKHHVIYVWMDALTNYVSALGGFSGALYETFWPESVHLIGKDILRFHAVYWPCFLLSAGLPLPKTVLCHGWWKISGRKISKSIPATRVDPLVLASDLHGDRALGVDALRYFLMREAPLGNDGDLVYENLLDRYNADLANDLGNLVNRALTMITRFGGQAPPRTDAPPAEPRRRRRRGHRRRGRGVAGVPAVARARGDLAPGPRGQPLRRHDPAVGAGQGRQERRARRRARRARERLVVPAPLVAPVLPEAARQIGRLLGADASRATTRAGPRPSAPTCRR